MSKHKLRFKKGRDYRKLSRKERRDHKRITGRKVKYETLIDHTIATRLRPDEKIESECYFVYVEVNGDLRIKAGFRWDGASGPTLDRATTMRASLYHDALYLLMREKKVDATDYRLNADVLLMAIMKEDGAWMWTAMFYLWAVHRFARGAAR